MMKPTGIALVSAALLLGCARGMQKNGHEGKTTVEVSGRTGAVVTGFYVREGRRYEITNAVPWSLSLERLSSMELRKRPEEEIRVGLTYESGDLCTQLTQRLPPGTAGARLVVRNGVVATWF